MIVAALRWVGRLLVALIRWLVAHVAAAVGIAFLFFPSPRKVA